MKLKHQITTLAVMALLAGCGHDQMDSEKQTDNEKQLNASRDTSQVQERSKEPAPATRSYVTENKDEFVASMEVKLKELDAKIAELGKKSESYKDDAREQADKALAGLREQRSRVNDKFDELKKSSAEAWKEVKAGFASAMTELEGAYENAKSKFN